jgi:hypothetical protein
MSEEADEREKAIVRETMRRLEQVKEEFYRSWRALMREVLGFTDEEISTAVGLFPFNVPTSKKALTVLEERLKGQPIRVILAEGCFLHALICLVGLGFLQEVRKRRGEAEPEVG